jgi:hypothetical protein
MLQPQNVPMKYDNLFVGIGDGTIKIPKFQREFVWGKQQTAKLIDSIIKGFPVGTFILWKTKEELRHFKNIGNDKLPSPPKGDAVQYVLDGQQRITSLYAVRKGLIITKEGKEIDYKDICINLSMDTEDDEMVVATEPPKDTHFISIHRLLNGTITSLVRDYSEELEKIETYKKRLTQYDFSTIVISDYPLNIACEVFTRINTGGTELTLFEIMVAKTYDEKRKFDFADEYDRLIDNNGTGKDLEDAGYETIPHSTVLQCVSAHLCKQVRRKDILKLPKSKFIKNWPVVKDGIFKAVDYCRSHLRIPVSRLLPYPALLVPLTYFFIRNNAGNPTSTQNKLLTQYFWWASLSNRFTSGAEGKIAADLKRMDRVLKEKKPSYKGEEFDITIDVLLWRWFSASEAFCKAIICLLTYFQPKSFDSGSLVMLDNSWLKQANSKNYHHFFPKAYLKKQGWDHAAANCVLNITLVGDDLNKRKIRAQAPSRYMKQFKRSNERLEETMRSHLIGNLEDFGVWSDDYERFISKRSQKVLSELKKRLYPNI